MIKLLKNAVVYNPDPIGKKDILIAGEKILRIADRIDGYDNLPDVEVYDLEGKTLAAASSKGLEANGTKCEIAAQVGKMS